MRFHPLIVFALTGCVSSLDLSGQDETVTQRDDNLPDPLADDRIEDKHPQYDPGLTVTEKFDGCEATVNMSGAVTKLDIIPFEGADATALYPRRGSATTAESRIESACPRAWR